MKINEKTDLESNFEKIIKKKDNLIMGLSRNTFKALFFITTAVYLFIAYLIIVYK